jgi:hypothetical protein
MTSMYTGTISPVRIFLYTCTNPTSSMYTGTIHTFLQLTSYR